MLLIKNCNLISEGPYKDGMMDVLFDGSRIAEVAPSIDAARADEVIDAAGRWVTPGLIEPHAHTGGSGNGSQHINEKTAPLHAGLRVCDAVDLDHPEFIRALRTGVTSLAVCPGSSNLIGGTTMAVKSAGERDERVMTEELSMKMALGENPKMNYSKMGRSPATRMGAASLIREQLAKAREYREKWLAYQAGDEKSGFKYDIDLHSLMRVFDGMMCKIHAHQADDIMTAIRLGKEFGLNISVEHCTEGYLITDELLAAGYPVIIGPTVGGKSKFELYRKSEKAAGLLEKAGVRFAITTDNGVIPMDGLHMQACVLCKYGLSKETALKAMTINAAWAIGLDDRIGSIEPGKDADMVIWNMHPMDTYAKPDMVFINGKCRLKDGEVC